MAHPRSIDLHTKALLAATLRWALATRGHPTGAKTAYLTATVGLWGCPSFETPLPLIDQRRASASKHGGGVFRRGRSKPKRFCRSNIENWENVDLRTYLEAIAAWANDWREPADSKPRRHAAGILAAGSVYE